VRGEDDRRVSSRSLSSRDAESKGCRLTIQSLRSRQGSGKSQEPRRSSHDTPRWEESIVVSANGKRKVSGCSWTRSGRLEIVRKKRFQTYEHLLVSRGRLTTSELGLEAGRSIFGQLGSVHRRRRREAVEAGDELAVGLGSRLKARQNRSRVSQIRKIPKMRRSSKRTFDSASSPAILVSRIALSIPHFSLLARSTFSFLTSSSSSQRSLNTGGSTLQSPFSPFPSTAFS
jgi:hypothetical protein